MENIKSSSRVKNTMKNSIIGILAYGIRIIFNFIMRTYFIHILGVTYLGVSGLFTNILTMLSLTDLGIYTVMVYSLYGPLANHDKNKISALVKYFQKLYNIVALIIFLIGMLLLPLLPLIIKGSSLPISKINIYYILLLIDAVSSYLVISKSTILRADQKVYVVKIISTLSLLLMYICQIIILILFKNYLFFLVCQVFFTILSNVVTSLVANKIYPFLKRKSNVSEIKRIKKKIISNLKSSFLYKVGSKIMLSTDNILISVIISTNMVGYYSNYVTIFSMVSTIIMIFIESVLASIGNFLAVEDRNRKYKLFRVLCYAFYFLASFCCACYIAVMNDFIAIWIGKDFVLEGNFIYFLALYRFVFCIINPVWMIRESSGIFISTQYVMVVAAILNIILSFLLGSILGVSGIVLATAIAYLLTVYIYEPKQIMNKVFERKVKDYWKLVIKLLLYSTPIIVIGCLLGKLVTHNLFFLFLKVFACFVISSVIYYIVIRKSDDYDLFKSRIKRLIKHNH